MSTSSLVMRPAELFSSCSGRSVSRCQPNGGNWQASLAVAFCTGESAAQQAHLCEVGDEESKKITSGETGSLFICSTLIILRLRENSSERQNNLSCC